MADKKKPVRPPSRTAGLLQLPVEGVPKMPQGLLSYEPTLREKIANAVYDGSVGLLGKRKAHEMQANTKSAVDFVPGLGDAVGANDMARDYRAGNYGMAALSAIGLIPAVGDVVSKTGKKALANAPDGIRAFHGSPHSFDKFSLDKIGTGEGAQAYGHGLYFADNESVARSYKNALSDTVMVPDGTPSLEKRVAQMALTFGDNTQEGAIQWLNKYKNGANHTSPAMTPEIVEEVSKRFANGDFKPGGSMYEVNIRANPDDFLDWDKPLSEQPQKVREALTSFGAKPDEAGQNAYYRTAKMTYPIKGPDGKWIQGGKTYEDSLAMAGGDPKKVNRLMNGFPADKTEALREAGIPGIKYLDAGSRGAGDGSRNYVVFDEKLIDIVRKYGLASAIGAGIISKEMGQQMQAQGDI